VLSSFAPKRKFAGPHETRNDQISLRLPIAHWATSFAVVSACLFVEEPTTTGKFGVVLCWRALALVPAAQIGTDRCTKNPLLHETHTLTSLLDAKFLFHKGEQRSFILPGHMDTASHAKEVIEPKLLSPLVRGIKEFGLPTVGFLVTGQNFVAARACR